MTEVTSEDTGTRDKASHGRLFVVTQERFVQIFGMVDDGTAGEGSMRRFGWCDQENYHSWNFSDVTSQAGFLDIEPASPIVAAQATRNGTLFFTAHKAYLSSFLGIPYVYNYVELGNNCTPWSPESVIVSSSMALWMSQQGIFSFDGTTIAPVACLVRPWIDDDIDLINAADSKRTCMVHVGNCSMNMWWFFPQLGQPLQYQVHDLFNGAKVGSPRDRCHARRGSPRPIPRRRLWLPTGLVGKFEHELGDFYNNADLRLGRRHSISTRRQGRR